MLHKSSSTATWPFSTPRTSLSQPTASQSLKAYCWLLCFALIYVTSAVAQIDDRCNSHQQELCYALCSHVQRDSRPAAVEREKEIQQVHFVQDNIEPNRRPSSLLRHNLLRRPCSVSPPGFLFISYEALLTCRIEHLGSLKKPLRGKLHGPLSLGEKSLHSREIYGLQWV